MDVKAKTCRLRRARTSIVQWYFSGERADDRVERQRLQPAVGNAEVAGGQEVVGLDPSTHMIAFAREHFLADHANLDFVVGDASRLSYRDAFDLVVSFNALHWIPDQAAALRCIRDAMRPTGRSLLQLVPQGVRKCLEDVIEETRKDPRWSRYFADYRRPYFHLPPEEYRRLAESCGLRVDRLDVALEAWDFGSRAAFDDFGRDQDTAAKDEVFLTRALVASLEALAYGQMPR